MLNEILDEYALFLDDIGNNSNFNFGKYLDASNYEDEYSHGEINEAMNELKDRIVDYVHKNYPNKFLVI